MSKAPTIKSAVVNGIAVVVREFADCWQVEVIDERGECLDAIPYYSLQKAIWRFEEACERIASEGSS